CAVCGSPEVDKALMAPSVLAAGEPGSPAPDKPENRPLSQPRSMAEQVLRDLRARIERTAEHVGPEFAAEARRIHAGDAPDRPIWGEARLDEARNLSEEGIPVAPLPWISSRKTS